MAHPRSSSRSQVGPVTIETPVILAPMTGVTDMPFRTLVRRFGSGLNVTEMIASEAAIRETRQSVQKAAWHADRRAGLDAAGRLRPGVDGRSRQDAGSQRRRDHRHQFRLPGAQGRRPVCRLGPDARSAAGGEADGSHGQGRRRAGDGQDADGLGPCAASTRPNWRISPRISG